MSTKIVDLEVDQKNTKMSIPLGYLPIELSTKGKLGVPKVVYCRNFNTEDIVTLSMLSNTIMPERIISVLNSVIYGDVDVSKWPDQTIIELLVLIYANYFTPILPQIAFPWDSTDVEWLKNHNETKKIEALEKKLWVPRIDLNLQSININYLTGDIKDTITIKRKPKDGRAPLEISFQSYPKYGDVLALRKLVGDKFKEEEAKYTEIELLSEMYSKYIDEDKDISQLPPLNTDLYLEWQDMILRKNIFLADATQAFYLQKFNGEDLTNSSIDEKIKYLKRPEFDINISNALNKQFESLNFGLDPEVKIKNPITGEDCTRRFVFRINDILQAIRTFDSGDYDISYD